MLNYVYSSISGKGIKADKIHEVCVELQDQYNNHQIVAYYLNNEGNQSYLIIKNSIRTLDEANEAAKDFCNKLWGNGHRKKFNRLNKNQYIPQEEIDILMKEVEEP